ncbi:MULTISPECIES: hypothetical protein [Mediterraneibacter]|uniref:hypothetical protein n=1 Tax=Mediterraneibacter TaxID=2316020 RepID=UPI0022E89728|nr:hypothetical protein [Mediterraneibacter massiliensis]
MRNNRAGNIFRIIAGAYLAYLGVQLVSETIQNKPTNELFNIVMGVLFIAVGVWFAIGALREILKEQKAERESEQQPEVYETAETKEKTLRDHLVQTEEKEEEKKKETEAKEEKDEKEIKEKVREPEQSEDLEADYEEK